MKLLTFAALCAFSLGACAQGPAPAATAAKPGAQSTPADAGKPAYAAGTPEARARDALRSVNPQIEVEHIGAAKVRSFMRDVLGSVRLRPAPGGSVPAIVACGDGRTLKARG